MTKKQRYMNRSDRDKLEAYTRAGKPVAWIARELGFCRQTIYNELRRGAYSCVRVEHGWYLDKVEYSAEKGQQIHDYNQTAKGRPLKIGNDRAYADFLEARCLGVQADGSIDPYKRYSPAAALALARRAGFHTEICTATFYSYIEKKIFLHLTNAHLWEKGRRAKRRYESVRRIAHPQLPNIADRPACINRREEPGHWEMDLIVGKAKTRTVLLTLYERQKRETLIFKLRDRKAATVRAVFDQLERNMPDFKERFRSITTDNGPEFLEYEELIKSIYGGKRFSVYYCHPYSAWEKGGNENHNRMIRRWYPKSTDFSKVTKKRIAELQDWMNGYPRKILGWRGPADIVA